MTTLQFQAFPDRIINVLSSMQDEVEFNFEYDENSIYNEDEDEFEFLDDYLELDDTTDEMT